MDSSTGPVQPSPALRPQAVRRSGRSHDRQPGTGREFEEELEGRARKRARDESKRDSEKKNKRAPEGPTRTHEDDEDGEVGSRIDVVC